MRIESKSTVVGQLHAQVIREHVGTAAGIVTNHAATGVKHAMFALDATTGYAATTSAAHDAVAAAYRIVLTDHELVKRYRKLSDRQQQALAEIITALATKDSRR